MGAGLFNVSQSHAAQAAGAYRSLGWVFHEARALKLAGIVERSTTGSSVAHALLDLRGIDPLSSREREVAALVANGAANKGIAKKLAVSQRTIEKHLTSIYDKLGLRNRAQLAAFLVRDSAR